jgi:hypothetical protein
MRIRDLLLGVIGTLALCVDSGCAGGPPQSLSFDPLFSQETRDAGAEAVAAWCDAVGWCPTIVPNQGESHFVRVAGPKPQNAGGLVEGRNGGYLIEMWDEDWLPEDAFAMFAHEMGHFQIDGHPSYQGRLMSKRYVQGSGLHEIDQEAIDAWRAGQ